MPPVAAPVNCTADNWIKMLPVALECGSTVLEAKVATSIRDVMENRSVTRTPHPPAGSATAPAGELSDSQETATIPHTVKYIIGQEFCERFSFYGMRAILALYLNERLHLTQNQATEMVHLFIVAAYLAPLAGAFICDSFLVREVIRLFRA